MHDSEHQTIQTILFLDRCVRSSTVPDGLEVLSRSENSKIRLLALKSCQGDSRLVKKYFRMDDPSSAIREAMISRSHSLPEIVLCLKDSNSGVKIAALRAISRLSIDRAVQNMLIDDLLPLINDREHEVRLLFTKILRKFNKLSNEALMKMFDKGGMGTLIYAAEDEYEDVRGEAVISLCHIIKKKAALSGFDFLMDILNDDSLRVRELAMKSMYKISKRYTIVKEEGGMFGVLVCLREVSPVLRRFLLKVVSQVRYRDTLIVSHLFNVGLEDREILETVRKVVKRNTDVFLDAMRKSGFLFSNDEDRTLYRTEYLVDLMVMRELMGATDLEVSDVVRKDLGLIMLPKYHVSGTMELRKIRDLLDSLDGHNAIAFLEEMRRMRVVTAFGKFVRDYLLGFPLCVSSILLVPYKFRFGKSHLRNLIIKHKMSLSSESPCAEASMISFVMDLVDTFISHPRCLELREYTLSLPEMVVRYDRLPVEFEAKIDGKDGLRNVFLVLESVDGRVSYPARNTVHVLLDDCPPSISCYLACKVRGDGMPEAVMVGITPKADVNIAHRSL